MKKLFLFIWVITSFNILAETQNQDGLWLGTFSNKKLNSSFNYWIEAQMRYNLSEGQTNQILYRTGLLQNLENDQGLGYLYGFIQTGNINEHRLTFQHTQDYLTSNNYKLSHRARLEGRFIEDDDNDSLRFRYLFRYDQLDFAKWGLVVWNEIFTNFTDEEATKDQFLERNRLFLGFKKGMFEDSRFEVGYMNQFVPRDAGDVSEHILTLYLFF